MPAVTASARLAATAVAALVAAALCAPPGGAAARDRPPSAAPWQVPVEGAVVRGFDLGSDPFEAGRHRGVDLAAAPGTVVRAPCSGAIAVAGRVGSSGRLVTLLCDRWRVTHLPLAAIAVRRGETVRRGARLGTVGASDAHGGLHVGVRRDGVRFGYVDPLRFFAAAGRWPPIVAGRRPPGHPTRRPPRLGPAPRAVARPIAAEPERAQRRHARTRPAGSSRRRGNALGRFEPARPAGSSRQSGAGAAPWPAWIGLALVLAGVGLGSRQVVRTRRGRRRAIRAQEAR